MGYITPASSGDPHLGKELTAFLQQGHPDVGIELGEADRRKKSCGSPANDYYLNADKVVL